MHNMIFAATSLFLGLPCSGQVIPAITSQKPNYTITITPPSGTLSLKSPLLVEMFYTNTTSSDIYLNVMICKICTGEHLLLMKDGKEVETTAFQRMSTGRGLPSDFRNIPPVTGNGRIRRFPPGVFWEFNLDLRKLYNITEPDHYTLIATRTEETRDGKFGVNSNTVPLNIVP